MAPDQVLTTANWALLKIWYIQNCISLHHGQDIITFLVQQEAIDYYRAKKRGRQRPWFWLGRGSW